MFGEFLEALCRVTEYNFEGSEYEHLSLRDKLMITLKAIIRPYPLLVAQESFDVMFSDSDCESTDIN